MRNWHDETLKIIAIMVMVVSHIGKVNGIYWLDVISEITFPIFSYLIAQGLERTKNKGDYFGRLAVFGVLSQMPYMLLFDVRGPLNPIIGLFIGGFVLEGVKKYGLKVSLVIPVLFLLGLDVYPVLLVLIFGLMTDLKNLTLSLAVVEVVRMFLYNPWCFLGLFGLVLVKGKLPEIKLRVNKWVYYGFYPLHLILLKGVFQ